MGDYYNALYVFCCFTHLHWFQMMALIGIGIHFINYIFQDNGANFKINFDLIIQYIFSVFDMVQCNVHISNYIARCFCIAYCLYDLLLSLHYTLKTFQIDENGNQTSKGLVIRHFPQAAPRISLWKHGNMHVLFLNQMISLYHTLFQCHKLIAYNWMRN